uniref:Putative secreted protein n=1 Tax=Ixodes ricinus TaxID=34613 RepID=A0A6B0UEK7_IXORI
MPTWRLCCLSAPAAATRWRCSSTRRSSGCPGVRQIAAPLRRSWNCTTRLRGTATSPRSALRDAGGMAWRERGHCPFATQREPTRLDAVKEGHRSS